MRNSRLDWSNQGIFIHLDIQMVPVVRALVNLLLWLVRQLVGGKTIRHATCLRRAHARQMIITFR